MEILLIFAFKETMHRQLHSLKEFKIQLILIHGSHGDLYHSRGMVEVEVVEQMARLARLAHLVALQEPLAHLVARVLLGLEQAAQQAQQG
jgi:hypothetical protein